MARWNCILRAILGSLWAIGALVVVLFVDAKTLPDRGSTVGELLNSAGPRSTWTLPIVYPGAFGYETRWGLEMFPNRRAAETAGLTGNAFAWAVELRSVRRRQHGFWAPTTLTVERELRHIRGDVPPDAGAFVAGAHDAATAAEFRAALAGRYTERHIIWSGVGHNAFALVIAGLLVASCWLNTPRLKPLLPSERRRKRGLCPRCGYDAAGLQRCPECGRDVSSLGGASGSRFGAERSG